MFLSSLWRASIVRAQRKSGRELAAFGALVGIVCALAGLCALDLGEAAPSLIHNRLVRERGPIKHGISEAVSVQGDRDWVGCFRAHRSRRGGNLVSSRDFLAKCQRPLYARGYPSD